MKKILWLMMLLPIFMSRVWASDVYYSDYGNFSDYQEEYVASSDIVNVESLTMYRWYKNIKVPGKFKLYNSSDNFLDNCYETDYSSWSNTKPTITEATILEQKTIYNYKMIEKVRYIHLYNLKGSYDAFRIPELQVFVNGVEIDYSYTCDGCWDNFSNYIHNGIYVENESYIDNGGSLIIDLGKYYPINKVKILFYIFDMGKTDKEYTLGYSIDKTNIFISKKYVHQFSSEYLKDAQKFEYKVTDLGVSENLWLKSSTTEQYIDNEYVYSRTSYQQYRYKEKMCQTYTLEKEYYPQYSVSSVGEYTSKDTSKTFYRYQTRDKLELNIYDITEKKYDLNNFVISSTGTYAIKDNIDWSKNGVYNLTFTLNDLVVEDDVSVNILENALLEKEDEIKKLEEELQNTIADYEKIIATLEKNNEDYLNSLNELNIKIIEINNQINELRKIDNNTNETIDKLQSQLDKYIEEYNLKIQELDKNNQKYLENLKALTNSIYSLEEKVRLLKQNQIEDEEQIQELEETIQTYINEYANKIDDLENFKVDYLKKIEQIDLDIKMTNESLETLKNELETKYSEVTDRIDNLEEQLDEFSNLNAAIDDLKNEILKLQNVDSIQIENLNLLKKNLEEQLNVYQSKIENLEDFNNTYSQELTNLTNEIYSLYEQIINLEKEEDNNSGNIIDLKEDLEDNLKIYNEKINNLENFNKTYSENLTNTNLKINDLITLIEKTEIVNKNTYKELYNQLLDIFQETEKIKNDNIETLEKFQNVNDKITVLEESIEDIEISNEQKYNQLVEEYESLNTKINNYEQTIEDLKHVNESYLSQINLLNNEILSLNNKLENIELQINNNYDQEIENIKSNLTQVSKVLEEKNEDDINSKLNNFVLRINGVEKINLLWIYVLISCIFVGYVIFLFKKKSNKNNS